MKKYELLIGPTFISMTICLCFMLNEYGKVYSAYLAYDERLSFVAFFIEYRIAIFYGLLALLFACISFYCFRKITKSDKS